jgi:hypothetical protein
MSYEIITANALNGLKRKIQATLAAKNLDATGEASMSLEVNGSQLLGNDYLYYLDKGRAPGKMPPSLIDWVRAKLSLKDNEAKQVDFLVRRKISREGTEIFKNKSKGLELDKLVTDMLENITKELPDEVAVEALKWL